MVVKKYILKTLDDLESKYQASLASSNPNEPTYYAKLGLLEYCGWLEESLDDIVRRSVKGEIKTMPFRQMLEGSIIFNTHGFRYKDDFRPMLCRAVGVSRTERIQRFLDSNGNLSILETELLAVLQDRNDAAHTWIEGTTKTYPAPSTTRGRLLIVYPILVSLYREVMKK